MAWIVLFALLLAAMLTLSAMGAERNFRRTRPCDRHALDRFLAVERMLRSK